MSSTDSPAQAATHLSTTIQQHFATLPHSERKLAELILEAPGQLAAYSASEMSKMAGVSNATVTRLVRRLGYTSYDQMRRLSREGMDWGSPLFMIDPSTLQQNHMRSADTVSHIESSNQNILNTLRRLDRELLDKLGGAMMSARKIVVYGERNNHFFAGYLRWQLVQFRENVTLLPSPGETSAESLTELSASDFAIVFGMRRRTPQLNAVLQILNQSGVPVLLITDNHGRCELPYTWHIACDTRSPLPLDNHTAVMAVCHVLSEQIIENAGAEGRKRLSKIEKTHTALKEL